MILFTKQDGMHNGRVFFTNPMQVLEEYANHILGHRASIKGVMKMAKNESSELAEIKEQYALVLNQPNASSYTPASTTGPRQLHQLAVFGRGRAKGAQSHSYSILRAVEGEGGLALWGPIEGNWLIFLHRPNLLFVQNFLQ